MNRLEGIGIVGGVGPEAGTLLHRYVIAETARQKQTRGDRDHLPVVHISASNCIPDRTAFLNGAETQNPANAAFTVAQLIDRTAETLGRMVVGVPCNTFHAPQIWDEFVKQVREAPLENIEIVNMIEATGTWISNTHPNLRTIGLMSTTGTRNTGIYKKLLEARGLTVVETDRQDVLHDTIYNPDFGIKAVTPISDRAQTNFYGFARELKEKGAEALILGCTEIPLAFEGTQFEGTPLIDPMRALAAEMVGRVLESQKA